jgi:hypothetical protein
MLRVSVSESTEWTCGGLAPIGWITAGLVAATAGLASATTVQLAPSTNGAGLNVSALIGSHTESVWAGQSLTSLSNWSGSAGGEYGARMTFALEPFGTRGNSSEVFTVRSVASALGGSGSVNNQRATAIDRMYSWADGLQLTADTSNTFAAAFQLAVWEVANDYNPSVGRSSLSFDSGAFRSSLTGSSWSNSQIRGSASLLFDSILFPNSGNGSVLALTKECYQDRLVWDAVPTPGTAAIAGVGLVMIGKRRRSGSTPRA